MNLHFEPLKMKATHSSEMPEITPPVMQHHVTENQNPWIYFL
jgi:hypothetical protein